MVTKQKRSFFEKLTGAVPLEEPIRSGIPVYTEEETHIIMQQEPTQPEQPTPTHSATPTHQNWLSSFQPSEDSSEGQLTIDVYQTDGEIVIKSTIAGVKPEDLDVAINNDMVTIKGERKNEEIVDESGYYYQECYWGAFSRSVLLPVDVIPEKADAALKNGILTIRLPKADTNKTKKIQVRGF